MEYFSWEYLFPTTKKDNIDLSIEKAIKNIEAKITNIDNVLTSLNKSIEFKLVQISKTCEYLEITYISSSVVVELMNLDMTGKINSADIDTMIDSTFNSYNTELAKIKSYEIRKDILKKVLEKIKSYRKIVV